MRRYGGAANQYNQLRHTPQEDAVMIWWLLALFTIGGSLAYHRASSWLFVAAIGVWLWLFTSNAPLSPAAISTRLVT